MTPVTQRCERGAAAVELALLLPILVLLIFGIVEGGRAYNTQLTLSHAVREGARTLALDPDHPANAVAATRAAATSLDESEIDVTTAGVPCDAGTPVRVTATYDIHLIIPFLSGLEKTLSATGVMKCAG